MLLLHSTTRIRSLYVGIILISIGLTACCAVAEPFRVSYAAINMLYGPLWLTYEAGIFKKYKLDVEPLYIGGGTLSTTALIRGDVQIAFTGAANVISANMTGADVVLIGSTIDLLPFELWAIPTIKEPHQLKGTRMGVSRFGTTSDFVGRYLLKSWGLHPNSDVVLLQSGEVRERLRALEVGSIQSTVIGTGPFTFLAQKHGLSRLADVSTMGLPYIYGGFAARRQFLQSQPDVVNRFMRAYVEGIYHFKTNKRLAISTVEKYYRTKATQEVEQLYNIFASQYIKRIPKATSQGVRTVMDEIQLLRPISSGTIPEQFIESKFADEIAATRFADVLYQN